MRSFILQKVKSNSDLPYGKASSKITSCTSCFRKMWWAGKSRGNPWQPPVELLTVQKKSSEWSIPCNDLPWHTLRLQKGPWSKVDIFLMCGSDLVIILSLVFLFAGPPGLVWNFQTQSHVSALLSRMVTTTKPQTEEMMLEILPLHLIELKPTVVFQISSSLLWFVKENIQKHTYYMDMRLFLLWDIILYYRYTHACLYMSRNSH